MLTVTVSQLNRYVKAVLEEDDKLSDLYIRGEISNYTRHFRSGHLYFSLKDAGANIRAVMFKSHAQDLKFEPENGMSVLVRAKVGVYEAEGIYQLYVTDIQPEGAGARAVAFDQVKQKLAKMGLFEPAHKKEIPAFPRRIGVVTSETGAALQDIINVLDRRYPLATVVLSPALVQGRDAPASLIRALTALDQKGRCDVIILGRGGGSAEDLWGFNDEDLAQAIFAAETPIISAVGHEVDYTICDFVADLRAPTPSAAAELAAAPLDEARRKLASCWTFFQKKGEGIVISATQRLDELSGKPCIKTPLYNLMKKQEKLDFFSQSLYNKKRIFISDYSEKIIKRAALLDSMSPLRVLGRGYCAAFVAKKAVTSVAGLVPGDDLTLRFRDGTAQVTTQSVDSKDLE